MIGAVLDAASEHLRKNALIADPFSGGGTVAIEAVRRSLNIYAQDVNPWASWGLRVSLTAVDPDELAAAGELFLQRLRSHFALNYRFSTDSAGSYSHVHTFRVRTTSCDGCGEKIWMFPYPMVTMASRAKDEKYGFFGCRACGGVTRQSLNLKQPQCPICKHRYAAVTSESCPHCRRLLRDAENQRERQWSVVLVQGRIEQSGNSGVEFRSPSREDVALAIRAPDLQLPPSLARQIPAGNETAKLLRFGFTTWADLYPSRQLHILLSAARELSEMKMDEPIQDRLMLCIAGATEMPGHICRWDRFNPKAFEGLANHRYSFDGLAVEPNPLSTLGRGNLARRISASVAAARWLVLNRAGRRKVMYGQAHRQRHSPATRRSVTVISGSSERILLRRKSVSLILTDPPYFDSVHYGELSSLFLAWTPGFGIARRAGRFFHGKEAVPKNNSKRSESAYAIKLSRIFRQCARVLKNDGKLVLTFHSRNLHAWSALTRALSTNGFKIVALAAAETENGSDHAKRGKNSFLSDLLIECRITSRRNIVTTYGRARSPEQRELLHIGAAMTEVTDGNYLQLRDAFLSRTARMRKRKIIVSRSQGE